MLLTWGYNCLILGLPMNEAPDLYQQLHQSFKQVYLTYYDKVYTCAYFYLKHHQRAQDITQSIFLRLWENWDHLEIENFENYLFVTTKHRVYNEFKKLAVQSRYKTFLKERFSETESEIEENAILSQQLHLLNKAVQSLPTRQQLAWKLSREEGMTHKQIAKQMGISPPTVKELIGKALHTLKAVMNSLKAFFFSI
jgi:RNA polymerase sigma-70 factor (ECF subfamily)